ncbi:MAG: cation transporter, partial [Lysobacterales bacterium]
MAADSCGAAAVVAEPCCAPITAVGTARATVAPADACCAPSATGAAAAQGFPTPGMPTFRISAMDCAVEEGAIRNALERVEGIRRLNFKLAARTLAIDAPTKSVEAALAAIRGAGFDPQPVSPGTAGAVAEDLHDHAETAGPWRLALALALAITAEAIEFLLTESTAVKGASLAIAALAVWLAGVDTY